MGKKRLRTVSHGFACGLRDTYPQGKSGCNGYLRMVQLARNSIKNHTTPFCHPLKITLNPAARIHPHAWCPAVNIAEDLWSLTSCLALSSAVLKPSVVIRPSPHRYPRRLFMAVNSHRVQPYWLLQVRCNLIHTCGTTASPFAGEAVGCQLDVKTGVADTRTRPNANVSDHLNQTIGDGHDW